MVVNTDEVMFYLESWYFARSGEQRTFIQDISSEKNITFFEAITDYLKTLSKFMKEGEDFIRWLDINCIESIQA